MSLLLLLLLKLLALSLSFSTRFSRVSVSVFGLSAARVYSHPSLLPFFPLSVDTELN